MAMALFPAVLMGLIPPFAYAKTIAQRYENYEYGDPPVTGVEAVVGWTTFAYGLGVALLGVCHLWWLHRARFPRDVAGLDRATRAGDRVMASLRGCAAAVGWGVVLMFGSFGLAGLHNAVIYDLALLFFIVLFAPAIASFIAAGGLLTVSIASTITLVIHGGLRAQLARLRPASAYRSIAWAAWAASLGLLATPLATGYLPAIELAQNRWHEPVAVRYVLPVAGIVMLTIAIASGERADRYERHLTGVHNRR